MIEIVENIFRENNIPFNEIVGEKNMNYTFFNDSFTHIVKFYNEFEKAALEKAIQIYFSKGENVPVPKIIKFGQVKNSVFVLRECIPGKDMSTHFKEKGCDELLVFEAGAYLAKIHQRKFDKKGLITSKFTVDEYPIFSKNEYQGFLAMLKDKIDHETYLKLMNIDVDEYFEVDEYSMCHGDYAMKNIIVDQGEIISILDFEWVSAAPPMDDIASFEFFLELNGYQQMIPAFRRGYKSVSSLPEMFLPNRDFYVVYKGLTMLATHFSQALGVFSDEEEKQVLSLTMEYVQSL